MTRFAPSPTGQLHVGHAYAAQFARNLAGEGQFLLRLEDIDLERCRPEYVDGIFEDLRWLGLDWHGDVLVQSARADEYRTVMNRLKHEGLVYPCFCSRREVLEEIARVGGAPHGDSGPVYPGTCRGLSEMERTERLARGDEHCWRLCVTSSAARAGALDWEEAGEGRISADLGLFGDVVLGQKESGLSYFLCCTVDDAFQGVEVVTRGRDLKSTTVIQRLLQKVLGYPEPRYSHHRLVVDSAGQRLAKRTDGLSIKELRHMGWSPDEVFEYAELHLS